jgi:phosphatidylinositol alpha-1,6-mannosyltransferase
VVRLRDPSLLLALTGLEIDGGIAAVSRCVARAVDEEIRAGRIARSDRVLMLDDPARAAPAPVRGEQRLARGSQARFVWQTWRTYRRHRHDLVFFDLIGLARSILLPLPVFPPPRYAIFVHGIELTTARTGSRARALGRATRLLANSEFTAEMLRAQRPELEDRIRVVPLCIDPVRVCAWEACTAETPSAREPAALIVGRMASEERGKGHDELIAAWPEVRRRSPDAELWVVGGGDDVERLRARARESGAGEAVRFLGRIPDLELSSLYRRASLFVMPSRQEGFGVVYAEAMWHGLPCIGSTADAAGRVIDAGETGLLVPYGDVGAIAETVATLLGDPDRARRMGQAGRRRALRHFTYDRFRSDLLRALELG